MKTYTLHAAASASAGDPAALEKAELVRDGFSWLAFVFTFLWFFFNRLWLAGLAVLALLVALHGAIQLLHLPQSAATLAQLLVSILIGLEASSLKRWTYTRRGRPARDVVLAADREEAETKAFARWLHAAPPRSAAIAASAPGPRTSAPYRPEPVLGLFPEAERGR